MYLPSQFIKIFIVVPQLSIFLCRLISRPFSSRPASLSATLKTREWAWEYYMKILLQWSRGEGGREDGEGRGGMEGKGDYMWSCMRCGSINYW